MVEKLMLSGDCVREIELESNFKEYEIDVIALNNQGYVEIDKDQNVVDKAVLNESEEMFFKRHKDLPCYDYEHELGYFVEVTPYGHKDERMYKRLLKAYFCGYTPKNKDPRKYYVHFKGGSDDKDKAYLNVNRNFGGWFLSGKENTDVFKTQFDNDDFERMKRMELYKGIDFETLKVQVPDDELGIVKY